MGGGITGIGACVMDTLITLDTFPTEDTKKYAEVSKAAGGGPVATGLVAAAKLGESASFIGVLSDDGGGKFLAEDFRKYGVGTDLIEVKKGYRSFVSWILLSRDTDSRTCLLDRGNLPALSLSEAQKQEIARASILMIDGNEMPAARQAVRIARENGTTVLYDCGGRYPGYEELLEWTDVMIPSLEFALAHTGKSDASAAAKALYEAYHPRVVVVTCGKEGGVLYDENGLYSYPVYPVRVADSNGSGDVFHGAFAAGLRKGFDARKCCHFASAVSAVKCTGLGARESVPDFETVCQFLKENGYEL